MGRGEHPFDMADDFRLDTQHHQSFLFCGFADIYACGRVTLTTVATRDLQCVSVFNKESIVNNRHPLPSKSGRTTEQRKRT